MQRYVSLDICDYTDTPLCNLYDSSNDISGQAVNIVIHTERNGYKEIRFTLPSRCFDEDEEKDNYRLDYLISDFRLRYLRRNNNGEFETDWFLISESKVVHNAFSKNYDVTASHISYLLKTKNLDLEFSDEEGNNVGTIEEIAKTILDGTGWHIGKGTKKFYEDKKYTQSESQEKIRSFTASGGTGAFKMISDLCDLFDAKPIYHGAGKYIEDNQEKIGRTVDLVPMNPFSEDLEEGAIPSEVLEGEGVLELHYDKSIKSLTRTLQTENMITKLSAYGSYGDRSGQCSLQEAEHAELIFDPVTSGKEYKFEFLNSKYYFTATEDSDSLKWSYLDFVSRSYVYDGTNLFEVYKESKTNNAIPLNYEVEYVKNYFPFIMDFSYYRKVGLLNDEMLLALAEFQSLLPQKYIDAIEASYTVSDSISKLTNNSGSSSGFAKLKILSSDTVDGSVVLTLDKRDYSDGIIYRSDYMESKRNSFGWYTATGLRENGMAIAGKGSVVYIVHHTDPVSWEKIYVRAYGNGTDNYYRDELGNNYHLHESLSYADKDSFPVEGETDVFYVAENTKKMYVWFNEKYQEIRAADYNPGENKFEEPNTITLWTDNASWSSDDEVFLFSADDVAGLFGPREDSIVSNREALEESVKQGSTEVHPIYFVVDNDPVPDVTTGQNGYAWYYRSYTNTFGLGDLYFCWGNEGEVGWSQVYISKGSENPEELTPSGDFNYYYHIRRKMLYKLSENAASEPVWEAVKDSVNKDRMTSYFAAIIVACNQQELLIKGVKEQYYYEFETDPLPQGNYAFRNEFDNYWLFSTTMNSISSSTGQLRYYSKDRIIWQDEDQDHIIKAKEYPFDVLEFPVDNEIYGRIYTDGDFVNEAVVREGSKKVTAPIYVHDNVEYEANLPAGTIIVFNDSTNKVIDYTTLQQFTTPNHTSNIALVCPSEPTSAHYIRVKNYDKVLFQKNVMYKILPCASSGKRTGIYYLMDQFLELAHQTFEVSLPALRSAQDFITTKTNELAELLGDMYREGKWQETNYVEGDEGKLYSDALDNLKEVSHPEATYDFTYIDLFGSDKYYGLSVDESYEEVDWPEIDISYAAHLVDMDLDTNCWAYIDVIDECIDKPWETKIEINTKLSMIGQQSFTDVISKIAEVANEVKANQSIYKRASVLSGSGLLAADRLEGAINVNKVALTGGPSNWRTDEKGNIIFETEDGSSAMMLTGQGWAISQSRDQNGDWDWRYMATGKGLTADAIYTGYLSAERLEAGSITTDKLTSTLGQELDISSNAGLNLFATIDGAKPAGGVNTPHPNVTDSYVEIKAQQGQTPAYINIQTGGLLNLYGSHLNLESNGSMSIKSGSTIDIQAGSEFLVNSPNFKVIKTEQNNNVEYRVEVTGRIVATSGQIAGYNIGSTNSVTYMYAGNTTSLNSTAAGVYLGTDGLNLGGKFVYNIANQALDVKASSILLGDKNSSYVELKNNSLAMNASADITLNANSSIAISANKSLALTTNGTLSIGKTGYLFTVGSNNINNTEYAYIQNGTKTSYNDTSSDGVYVGADGISLGRTATTVSGVTTYSIPFSVSRTGALTATNATVTGSITATSGKIANWTIGAAYIGNGNSVTATSVGVGDSTYAFWAGKATNQADVSQSKFYVKNDGTFKATSATIEGKITSSDVAITGGSIEIKNGNTTYFKASSSGAQIKGALTADSLYVGNNNIISNNKISLTADTFAGIGTSNSGIQITNDSIYVRSGGTINLTGSQMIGLSVTWNDVSGKPDILTVPTGMVIAERELKVYSGDNNYVRVVAKGTTGNNGVYIKGAEIKLDDITGSNHVYITDNGIELKGSRVIVKDANNNEYPMWGRDDIIVLKTGDDENAVINSMNGKHDWVLIKPYYNALVKLYYSGKVNIGYSAAIYELSKDYSGEVVFGNAEWYQYKLTVTLPNPSPSQADTTANLTVKLSNNSDMSNPVSFSGRVTVRGQSSTVTITSAQLVGSTNLLPDSTSLVYVKIDTENSSFENGTGLVIECTCPATVSKVPCTVYYFT